MNDSNRGAICFVLILISILAGWHVAALISWCGCAVYMNLRFE